MTTPRKTPEQLRSYRWFGRDELRSFGHRSRAKQAGFDAPDYVGKPVIGIFNTWSDLNSCHMHLKLTADAAKRGILQAGGWPMEVPVMSVGEMFTKPTSMLYRNFLAMETEEMLRSNPIDGAVLLGGCDKSTPGLLMGAICCIEGLSVQSSFTEVPQATSRAVVRSMLALFITSSIISVMTYA